MSSPNFLWVLKKTDQPSKQKKKLTKKTKPRDKTN